MQLLDWVVVATVGAIVLVLLDGFRRKWRDRRNRVVMKLDRNIPQEGIDPEEFSNSELPNGGARTLVRDNDPPAGSPLQRKRNYNLKDGRDKLRAPEPDPASVPVLMDPVEIEETDIEHANVFVTMETNTGFAKEELPPEVISGLDDEDEVSDDAADQFLATSGDPLMDGMRSNDDEHIDARFDDEPGPTTDTLASSMQSDDELAEELDDELDDELDHETDDALIVETDAGDESSHEAAYNSHDSANSITTAQQIGHGTANPADVIGAEPGAEHDTAATDEYEEEYDPAQDEHYYENEPALFENAYKLATSRFQRQPKAEPAPRIEPGFGEAQCEPEESGETFGAIIDDSVMTELLTGEQEEIRAWRHQSVTRQREPEPLPTPAPEITQPAPQVTQVHIEPRIINVQPEPEPAVRAEPIATTPTIVVAAPMVSPATTPIAAPVTAPATTPKETKPGFWQTVTGKTNKPARPEPPKVDQGELFRDHAPALEPEAEAVLAAPDGPQEVIIVNVMSQNGAVFHGSDLMPVLQHYGLRLGNMNIFHRHGEVDGRGPVMFSMANMVKPGTFSLNDMDDFATPGLSFFVQLPNRHGNMQAFELMLATANGVKQALDGVLKDERRSVLTRQTVEHCRQRIRDFELMLLRRK